MNRLQEDDTNAAMRLVNKILKPAVFWSLIVGGSAYILYELIKG